MMVCVFSGMVNWERSWSDVVAHAVFIEESHLLLDRSIDTGITGMKTGY